MPVKHFPENTNPYYKLFDDLRKYRFNKNYHASLKTLCIPNQREWD